MADSEKTSNDRRKATRVQAAFRVKYSTLDQLVIAYTKNISQGGLFIRTDNLLPVNSVVRLVISLPNEGGEVPCIARVVRVITPETDKSERKRGLAVEFLDVSSNKIENIEKFIADAATKAAEKSSLPEFEFQLNILVIDDDKIIRERAADILKSHGHKVTMAENGLKGLAACLRNPPDLVLTDVQMPLMDGWNFLRTIRARPSLSSTLVIFQTTLSGEKERLKGYQLGVDDYLAKPYSAEELMLRVERLFSRSAKKNRDPAQKALRGELQQVSLPTVLSMLELEQKTGVVMVVGEDVCRLYVKNGRPLAVELENASKDLSPMEKVVELFRWDKGQFEFAPQDINDKDELQTSMQGLMMEVARLSDEENR